MFKVIPLINLYKKQVVLIKQGKVANVYNNVDPISLAKLFKDHGIDSLHFFDIDGVEKRTPKNYELLQTIVQHTNIEVDFAGGIETDGDLVRVFEFGAMCVTVASIAIYKKEALSSWIVSYTGDKITLGVDVLGRQIYIRKGMKRPKKAIDFLEHIEYFYERGVKSIKLVDVDRDGVMEGPNFNLCEEVVKKFPNLQVFSLGGVRDIDDVKKLRDIGASGVILGRALYENKIQLTELEQFAN